jgi:hypothetical protein
MPHGEEGLGYLLVGGRSGTEAKAGDDARGTCGHEQTKALVPPQAVAPSDVGVAGQPSFATAFGVPNGHRRAVQGLVRTFPGLHCLRKMQSHLLDEVRIEAHQPVELGAVRQGGKSLSQVATRVAVEIPFAGEPGPPGEDGQGDHFAVGEGRLGAGSAWSFGKAGLAEIIHSNVECSEEGVLRSTIGVRLLPFGDRLASRL